MKSFTCLACGHDFKSPKVRRSKYVVSKVDTDFCTYYKKENPLYYNVNICPVCGYGFTEGFTEPGEKTKEELKNKIFKFNIDFTGKRSIDLAILSYRRAIDCALLQRAKNILLAGLTLHTAWLYRFSGDGEPEKKYLAEALNYYKEAYERDTDVQNIGRMLYLMGDLSRRLGNDREAILFFTRVINDKSINDAGIIRMSRERWQDMRGTK
ncbi:MAG TPA: DUF2225 domain-containing protein [Firmicutes bacterium]|nr:DUF2225 domain-containing protein [Bacillota bacterium]